MTDIPLTVIGGYLGSGKTTLLNEMLDRRDGRRIAVIVNDFGQISIDAQILGEREGRTWEIVNGCICCDLADGMAAAIESIRSATPPPASVFAEVSGVGQPDVVARWEITPASSTAGPPSASTSSPSGVKRADGGLVTPCALSCTERTDSC